MTDARSSELAGLLQAYCAHERDEREAVRRMLALLESAGPLSRAQFAPGHFTASAFVLSPEADALLLIHHARLGRWLQPGGHVEPGDPDLCAAARRELKEEVGLVDLRLALPGIFDVDVHDIPRHRDEPAHAHFDVRFLFRARDRSVTINDEAHAARWLALSEIGPGHDGSIRRAVGKIEAARPLLTRRAGG